MDALAHPLGLFGVMREQWEGVFPEFAGLGQKASYFESMCVFGELVEADTVNERVALRASQRFEGKVGVAVRTVANDGMGNGRHGCSKSILSSTPL